MSDIYCQKCGVYKSGVKLSKKYKHCEETCEMCTRCNIPMRLSDPPEHIPHVQTKNANFAIIADIQPYITCAVDKETNKRVIINSRKQHREFLTRNNYVEIGNDIEPMSRKSLIEREEQRKEHVFNTEDL